MKNDENRWTSIEKLWKSMKISKIDEIHNIYGMYLLRTEKIGYILCSKHIHASHICPPKRNKLSEQRNGNWCFQGNMDFDLQVTYQSHYFYENLKWSHNHYGHFAPAGLTGNPDRSSVFDKSVERDLFKVWGSVWGLYSTI